MAMLTSYKTGTITVAADGAVVTGAGTNWTGAGIREGDVLWAGGVDVAVQSVESATQMTLAFPWPGASLSAAAYELRFTPDSARVLASSREAIVALESTRADAVANMGIFPTQAAGLAATVNAQQFYVRSSDGYEMIRYRRDSATVATEVGRVPTLAGIDAQADRAEAAADAAAADVAAAVAADATRAETAAAQAESTVATVQTTIGAPQYIWHGAEPVDAASSADNKWYIVSTPLIAGYLQSFKVVMKAAGPVSVRVYNVTTDGSNTTVTPVSTATVQAVAGVQTFDLTPQRIAVAEGQLVGISGAGIAYGKGGVPSVLRGWPLSGTASGYTFTSPTVVLPSVQFKLAVAGKSNIVDMKIAMDQAKEAASDWPRTPYAIRSAAMTSAGQVTVDLDFSGTAKSVIASVTLAACAAGMGRYDLVCLDPWTSAISVITGVEVSTGAAGYRPARPTDGRLPILLVRVGDTGVLTVIHLWRLDHTGFSRSNRTLLRTARESVRHYCPAFARKAAGRRPLHILAIGDSITNCGTGPANGTAAPNGAGRDNAGYITGFSGYPAAYGAGLPLYTGAQIGRDDTATNHVRIGAVWGIVSALESYGYVLGTDLWYDNWGISGAAAYDVVSATGVWTAWGNNYRAKLASTKYDLVIVAFGMNGMSLTTTRDSVIRIANEARASGADVLVMDTAEPRAGASTLAAARQQIAMAADGSASGFVSWGWLDRTDVLEAYGVAPDDRCQANNNNHPGPEELAAMGRLMSHLLLP